MSMIIGVSLEETWMILYGNCLLFLKRRINHGYSFFGVLRQSKICFWKKEPHVVYYLCIFVHHLPNSRNFLFLRVSVYYILFVLIVANKPSLCCLICCLIYNAVL